MEAYTKFYKIHKIHKIPKIHKHINFLHHITGDYGMVSDDRG